jgi:hypothetical protein
LMLKIQKYFNLSEQVCNGGSEKVKRN